MKRGAGRPKKPPEYWRDLARLLEQWEPAMPGWSTVHYGPPEKPVGKISKMCRNIADLGGVQWVDGTGKIVHEITDEKVLRTRFTEAWQKAQQEQQALQRMGATTTYSVTPTPIVMRPGFVLSSSSSGSRRTKFQIPTRKKKLHNY